MKGIHSILVAYVLLGFACFLALAFDPSTLQDFFGVIDDPKNGVLQGPKLAVAEDFFHSGLNNLGNTLNQVGSNVTTVNVVQIPGLNTLGKCTLYVGFVTSNPENRLFSKILYPVPIGLIHFQFNIGNTPAVAFAGLSSQNAGVITIANAVFGSNPPINRMF
ncbi:Germin-like protein subfamily 1 member 15 [Hibiscus syriacus]|uniref:Germin-like protein n=1 Tax=Hibiscus syriacus TaxID=106335 RepID=A0A6A2ZB15_HIBSY|nr:Germin-like protein subfamily 1 member 15 [Hibiscus syriacus]